MSARASPPACAARRCPVVRALESGRLDARRGWSTSRSTHVDEIDDAGTKNERVLNAGDQHGFLWRLNTYWTVEERAAASGLDLDPATAARLSPTQSVAAARALPVDMMNPTDSTRRAVKRARAMRRPVRLDITLRCHRMTAGRLQQTYLASGIEPAASRDYRERSA